jgi:hypothetical protein
MPAKYSRAVRDQLEKCRAAAIAAVEGYNRPGSRFRTAQYIVFIAIAWTALFHAVYYRQGKKPWYTKRSSGTGRGTRYVKIDGEPKHWELAECIKQYYGGSNPPQRKNLEFLLGLRNRIEHRHLPELDPSLFGECQASLLNLEDLVTREFGSKYALTEQLAVSLQFSRVVPREKRRAAKVLASTEAKSVRDYVERFRGNLPAATLNSMKYSYNVFLVPKVTNRKSAADAAIEFVHVDEARAQDLARLQKLNVLIREKKIPIANLDLHKPGQVVNSVRTRIPFRFNMSNHTDAWRHFGVRPPCGDPKPDRTRSEYCVHDAAHGDYLYTNAWVEKLVRECSSPESYRAISGREPDPITNTG